MSRSHQSAGIRLSATHLCVWTGVRKKLSDREDEEEGDSDDITHLIDKNGEETWKRFLEYEFTTPKKGKECNR